MIDIHCHLLPGIDDGASDLRDALALARIAVANGITHAVATPHIHLGRYENDSGRIEQARDRLWDALGEAEISLGLGFAAEVRIDPMILPMLDEGRIPFLGMVDGYHIMLLEFPHSHIPPGSDKLVSHLLGRNIRPMIAHPERNRDIMANLAKVEPFVRLGCLLQVTAGSVAGYFGAESRRRSIQMLEQGWVEVLASDAHNLDYRPPELESGRQAAAEVIGDAAAWDLVMTNPLRIVATGTDY